MAEWISCTPKNVKRHDVVCGVDYGVDTILYYGGECG